MLDLILKFGFGIEFRMIFKLDLKLDLKLSLKLQLRRRRPSDGVPARGARRNQRVQPAQ